MRRRSYLAVLGTAAVAGCIGGRTRFAGEPCPDLGPSPQYCYHSGSRRAPATLVPDAEHLSEPRPLGFTYTNTSGRRLSIVLPSFIFARRTDDGWERFPVPRQDDITTHGVPAGGWVRFGLGHADRGSPGDVLIEMGSADFGTGAFVFGIATLDAGTALARFDVGEGGGG